MREELFDICEVFFIYFMGSNDEFEVGIFQMGQCFLQDFFIFRPGAAGNDDFAIAYKVFDGGDGLKMVGYFDHTIKAGVAGYAANRPELYFLHQLFR